MAKFDFQDGSNLLSEKQIKFVSDVLEKHGFEGSKVTVETLGKAGDNYGSNVNIITAKREDGNILKMVAKIAPTSEFLRTSLNIEVVFGNEFVMYNKVLPKFRELEVEADIPEKDRLKSPICYGILDEKLHEIILLEDLRDSDFIMKDRFQSLTNEDIRVVLNSFAKLHSLSYVLKKKDPSTYKEFTSQLTDFFTSPQMEENAKNSFTLIEEIIKSLFDSDKYKNRVKGSIGNISNEARKLRRCDEGSKYSVIIHGDSWTNNIMFKPNKTSGITEECMLIDYQLSGDKCPVSDLLYLILNCSDYDTRSKHYNDWIDEYHDKLDKYLSNYGIKADFVYSKEKLLADLKRYSKFFLGWSMIIANVLCMDTQDAVKLKNAMDTSDNTEEIMETMKVDNMDNKTLSLLKTRVQGIIDSYYDLGYCS